MALKKELDIHMPKASEIHQARCAHTGTGLLCTYLENRRTLRTIKDKYVSEELRNLVVEKQCVLATA